MDQFGFGRGRGQATANAAKEGRGTAAQSGRSTHAGNSAGARGQSGRSAKAGAQAAKTASLGRLNAAHASPRAMERASPQSTVGQIAAYKAAVQDGNMTAAAKALAGVANKSVTTQTVAEFNDILGVTMTDAQISTVAAQARDAQAREPASRNGAAANSRTSAPSETPVTARAADLGRLNAAHASARAFDRASPRSTVGQIATYQAAVENKEWDKAAIALASAANKGITAESVRGLNSVLGVTVEDKVLADMVATAQNFQQTREGAPALR
jgi:hypothetical protein